ncbi:hypothetical protein A2276_04110 [candidate division WOR-1 bacterium RIFOXYA12_FULL_43_27]|uniref:Uncharacterized protein n=1 Tax=candidate division WOR-1 bacterium RIFOXYC2_FULL_46_14 TaxID=1802587 RepID=A0A1F4U6X7_UNCSA|nr:MAG: hypothetical protein A2276_04110 [candidate division WOR-1 bacterium RIFOXYA12_FULL_43_27]OGC19126.1 MAG: hypothetical protein A2292_00225 [candidate division WOR-1 bacterium RIFOXYB2_FULL_46_45]OGC30114.1 MAG: hypothetical protein A2232_00225 [candidate division WOR-1 bacterium RIFOXYA2_FULL_46_56]OGC40716.1 MAG: hypothetical protein A2438_00230 [candidate division WOR-1 bacterium RIFOXYC2_FULL_46_14]
MGDWVEIIYTKLPMLYGQLVENSVLEKLAVSLCLFTDAGIGNQDPFQIADFAEGDILDESIESLWLPLKNGVDCGGGNGMESYEMVAYYYLHHCDLKGSQNPFFFMTGDEGYYPKVDSFLVSNHFGSLKKGVSLDSLTVLQELARKFECFILRKPYHNGEKRVNDSWVRAWGPHRVLMLNEPAQVADTVIGAVALTKGVWTLERYLAVLQERNQTRDRIANVRETLLPYAEYLSRP